MSDTSKGGAMPAEAGQSHHIYIQVRDSRTGAVYEGQMILTITSAP